MFQGPGMSFEKNKENRNFKTSDFFIVLSLIGLVVVLSLSIVSEAVHDNRTERARFAAESLALQLSAASMELKQESNEGSRGPASVAAETPRAHLVSGELSTDPWGKPFHYKISRADDGKVTQVIVWSDGANSQPETNVEKVSLRTVKAIFEGDDVGFVFYPVSK